MKKLSIIVAIATVALVNQAHALQECQADIDCKTGFYCSLSEVSVSTSVPCATEASSDADVVGCADLDAGVVETVSQGYCFEKPIECQTDADCPSYLTCTTQPQFDGGGTTVGETAGTTGGTTGGATAGEQKAAAIAGSADVPVEEVKICMVKEITCQADSECPTDFECHTYEIGTVCGGAATRPECPPDDPNCLGQEVIDENCDPNTPVMTEGRCEPKAINCTQDSECPSDWFCMDVGGSSCSDSGTTTSGSSGGSTGSTGTGSSDTPPIAETDMGATEIIDMGRNKVAIAPQDDCQPSVVMMCVPKGYFAGNVYATSAGNDIGAPTYQEENNIDDTIGGTTATETPTDKTSTSTSSSSSDSSGCQSKANSDIIWFMAFGLMILGFFKKRTNH
jgi:hypothetical protein